MSFISASQLDALRAVAYQGLDTPVTILRREAEETDADVKFVWNVSGSAMGWLRQQNTPAVDVQTGRLAGTVNVYRLHLRHDTDILPEDRVTIGGEDYEVQDLNSENTIQVFRTATLRRIG